MGTGTCRWIALDSWDDFPDHDGTFLCYDSNCNTWEGEYFVEHQCFFPVNGKHKGQVAVAWCDMPSPSFLPTSLPDAARIAQLKSMPHNQYIQTREWKLRRLDAIAAAQYACEACDELRETQKLVAHHLCYDRIGEELYTDLQVLCPTCHWKAHAYEGQTIEEDEDDDYQD